jgi:hypothetical protein
MTDQSMQFTHKVKEMGKKENSWQDVEGKHRVYKKAAVGNIRAG